ncbi:MAG: hypothetical protein JWM21_2508 [Acidobacteria bacterium]|nr:hypothetical protein [Acidobacteriota bacterium]
MQRIREKGWERRLEDRAPEDFGLVCAFGRIPAQDFFQALRISRKMNGDFT